MTLVFLPHNAVCDCSWTESYWWVINDETAPSHNSVFLPKNRRALRTRNGVYGPIVTAKFNPLNPYATIRSTSVQRVNIFKCKAHQLMSESRYWYQKDAAFKEELCITTDSRFLLGREECWNRWNNAEGWCTMDETFAKIVCLHARTDWSFPASFWYLFLR